MAEGHQPHLPQLLVAFNIVMKGLINTLLLCSPISAVFQGRRHVPSIYSLPHDFHSVISLAGRRRKLQENTTNSSITCSLCEEFDLLEDVFPIYDSNETLENLSCFNLSAVAPDLDADQCRQLQTLSPQCCNVPPLYECDQRIRRALIPHHDSVTVPVKSVQDPLVVTVNLLYQSVTKLDVRSGTSQIFVWLDLTWKDPRLVWNISPANCSNVISARASLDAEITEIWVPDFDLYNVASGVQGFADALATVFPDGTVHWRRSGSLDAICQFSGLAQIPFDTLGCQFYFGPWNRFGFGHVVYELENGVGLEFGDFEPTYNEFKLIPEKSESGTTNDGASLFYTFYFSRAKNYYVFNIITPTIILTYVSFGTFLLDLRVGERLSYGMSLALVVVTQQIMTGDLIPVSDEFLWIDKFVGWSFYWVIFGLVESVLVGYIYFIREDMSKAASADDESSSPGEDSSEEASCLDEGDASANRQTQVEESPEMSSNSEGALDRSSSSASLRNAQGDTEEAPSRTEEESEEHDPLRQDQTFQHRMMLGYKIDEEQWAPFTHLPESVYKYPLRKVDHGFFFFTCISYTIFLIVMFTTLDSFGKGIDPIHDSSNSDADL